MSTTGTEVVITDHIFKRTHSPLKLLKKESTLHSAMSVKLLQKKEIFFRPEFLTSEEMLCWFQQGT